MLRRELAVADAGENPVAHDGVAQQRTVDLENLTVDQELRAEPLDLDLEATLGLFHPRLETRNLVLYVLLLYEALRNPNLLGIQDEGFSDNDPGRYCDPLLHFHRRPPLPRSQSKRSIRLHGRDYPRPNSSESASSFPG